ncbi:MAG: FadR/GntR family transcriptional regulator [Ancrocorticia sp.]
MGTNASWMSSPDDIQGRNAVEAIFEDIRHAIERGDVELGQRLPGENALAAHYGVSRPVVREALRCAATLGLTTTKNGSGTYVRARSPRPELNFGDFSTRDLMEARPFIEPPASAWAAIRRSESQMESILSLCERMESEYDPEKWVQLDSEFHVLISVASGNRVFSSIINDAREALEKQSQIVNLVAHGREDSNVEHRRVAEAIDRQDSDAARLAMRAHLLRVEGVMRPMIFEG